MSGKEAIAIVLVILLLMGGLIVAVRYDDKVRKADLAAAFEAGKRSCEPKAAADSTPPPCQPYFITERIQFDANGVGWLSRTDCPPQKSCFETFRATEDRRWRLCHYIDSKTHKFESVPCHMENGDMVYDFPDGKRGVK